MKRKRALLKYDDAPPSPTGLEVAVYLADDVDAEVQRLRELLVASKRSHYVCEDCWYSCPKSGECCNEFRKQDECDCGADEWNAKVDTALSTST